MDGDCKEHCCRRSKSRAEEKCCNRNYVSKKSCEYCSEIIQNMPGKLRKNHGNQLPKFSLDMENTIGNFTVGKDFDALLIDLKCKSSSFDVLTNLSLNEMVQKFLYSGDDRNIRKVFVKGRLVTNKT